MYDDTDDMLLGSSSGMEGPLLDGLQILWQVSHWYYESGNIWEKVFSYFLESFYLELLYYKSGNNIWEKVFSYYRLHRSAPAVGLKKKNHTSQCQTKNSKKYVATTRRANLANFGQIRPVWEMVF